jgi:large subunit ribosomal protein L2
VGIRAYKPTSPGRRFQTVNTFDDLTQGNAPQKSLIDRVKRTGGRNSHGWVTIWHRGGGHKRRYRTIDFLRADKDGIPGTVATVEYDPNRSAHIALVVYADGEERYIVAPEGIKAGQKVHSGTGADILVGNQLKLSDIPLGTLIHNVELKPGKGSQLVRAAGTQAQLVAREGDYAQVRLPSGEVRMIHVRCTATIGKVGNTDHGNVSIGKAGRTRWSGKRPTVRGVAMNPIDHPMGGGEGKTSGGRHPCTPWGVPTKGYKTVRKKPSLKFIVKARSRRNG